MHEFTWLCSDAGGGHWRRVSASVITVPCIGSLDFGELHVMAASSS